MRLICPFVPGHLRPETQAALEASGRPIEWREIPADDPYAYSRLLAELWEAGEAFALVEQDIVPTPADLDGLEVCPERICCPPYAYFSWRHGGRVDLVQSFGLVRFSAAVLSAYPTLPAGIGSREWLLLDGAWWSVLDALGEHRHAHLEVRHLGGGQPWPDPPRCWCGLEVRDGQLVLGHAAPITLPCGCLFELGCPNGVKPLDLVRHLHAAHAVATPAPYADGSVLATGVILAAAADDGAPRCLIAPRTTFTVEVGPHPVAGTS